jgi:hypothetical protein
MQARIKIRDCIISSFSGNGVNIVANSAQGTDANNWSIDTVTMILCRGHGLYVAGTDACAGTGFAINSVVNGGWAIYDASQRGNTYIGAHTASNGFGAYKADQPDACNVFIGCYSEMDQTQSEVAYPGMILGGLHGSGIGGTGYFLGVDNPSLVATNTANTAMIEIATGNSGEMLALRDSNDPASPFRLKYTTGKFYLDWGNVANSDILQLFTRSATPANGYARDMSGQNGGVGFPKGYYGAGMKYRGEAAAPPASGNWLRGDIVYNLSPVAGGYIGWQCVTGGTPGTWKGFGQIEP